MFTVGTSGPAGRVPCEALCCQLGALRTRPGARQAAGGLLPESQAPDWPTARVTPLGLEAANPELLRTYLLR